MKKEFQDYLINQGYSIKTPSGNPSTVYDYQKRIDKVCEWEGYTWETLANNIGRIVVMYDILRVRFLHLHGMKKHLFVFEHKFTSVCLI